MPDISPNEIYKHTKERVSEIKTDLNAKIDNLYSYTEGIHKAFEDWGAAQDTKFESFSDKLRDKLDKITEIITRKTELDSALIAKIQNMDNRLIKVETFKEEESKTMAEIGVKVDQLINLMTKHSLAIMAKDIDSAHKIIREHEKRMKILETKAGKMALKILWYVLFTGIGAFIGYFIYILEKIK